MTAQEQMKAMLDQLMGTGRDGENNRYRVTFDNPRVCRSFLLDCCPHDILASTRMDIGECHKLHDLALRADFVNASVKKDYYYDIDAMEHLQDFINDCDQRTEQAKRRLKDTQEELSEDANGKAQEIHQFGEELGAKLANAEECGAQGKVEESLKLLAEVDELRKRKASAEQMYRDSMPASSYQQQKLRVCEVCCAYLGIHDNDRRLADHFGGKLHLGFIRIRERLDELKNTVTNRREQRDKEREERRKSERESKESRRSRSPKRSSDGRRSRSRERRRHRSRSRDRKRSRSRSRRSKSRERRRSRSGSRKRSRRSRSRSKSKHSSRRSRSSSRSRRRRSRSRSHSRRSKRSRSRSKRSRSPSKRSKSPTNGRTSPEGSSDPSDEKKKVAPEAENSQVETPSENQTE